MTSLHLIPFLRERDKCRDVIRRDPGVGNPDCCGFSQMVPIASMMAFAKWGINFNHRNLASQTILLDIAVQHWELLVLDLILSGLRVPVTNRKVFLKPSHMAALCFLICFQPGDLGAEPVLLRCFCLIVWEASIQLWCSWISFSFILSFHFRSFISVFPNQCMDTGRWVRVGRKDIQVIWKISKVSYFPFKSNHF